VLLVQPERDDRDMYAEFLRRAGMTPVVVSYAAPALVLAPNSDVIVTELLLPGSMDGIEFIVRVRGDRTNRVPIIVLTSSAWDTERERAQRAGCDIFLPKPCLPDRLLHEIRRLLAKSATWTRRRQPAKANLPIEPQMRRHPKRTG
jgi:two-component system cell cycle response regulator DivK